VADIPPQIHLYLVNQLLLASMMHFVYVDSDAAVIGVLKLLMTVCQAWEHRVVKRQLLHLLIMLQVN